MFHLFVACMQKNLQFLPAFEGNDKVGAIVEYVFSIKRFKLYVPSKQLQIAFTLSGIELPLYADEVMPNFQGNRDIFSQYPLRDNEGYPILENEAFHYVRDLLLQRDVEVDIKQVNKAGTFTGRLFIQSQDISLELLQRGYARLNLSVAKKMGINIATAYKAKEDNAKKAKAGFWTFYDPTTDEQAKKREMKKLNQELPMRNV